MTEHYQQNRSNFRTGEPVSHFEAKDFIRSLLNLSGYDAHMEYPLVDSLTASPYKHNYDVVAFRDMLVVEIDDPNLHEKKIKMKNDRIAANHVFDYFPKSSSFIRLNKWEVNDPDTFDEYLSKAFWPYVH